MRRLPREHRYAPIEPFVEGIEEWLRQYESRLRGHPFHAITCRENAKARARLGAQHVGITELARRAGMDPRAIRRYLDRESEWIELDNADRIAMALGIPLWVLADEFLAREDSTKSGKPKVAA